MTLEYKGINIFYTDEGKGTPLVLLHGFLENSRIWQPFLPELSQNNRVLCIDLLGHGKTGCIGYLHTMEDMADAVQAVLKYLKIEEAIFLGHSMGGYVALAFAEKHPNALVGLCLMNSTAKDDSKEKKLNRDRAIEAVKQNHKTFIRIAINNLFRPKNRVIFSEALKQIIEEALKIPLQGIIAALEGMKIRKNREDLFRTLPIKKMLIIGKKDPVLDYYLLLDEVKNTDIAVIEFPDGHMSYIENESDFLLNIMHFIENI